MCITKVGFLLCCGFIKALSKKRRYFYFQVGPQFCSRRTVSHFMVIFSNLVRFEISCELSDVKPLFPEHEYVTKFFSCCAVLIAVLTLCLLGNFACFLFSAELFQKNISVIPEYIRVSNSLDPDQDRHVVGPDLGPNCLQRLHYGSSRRH